MQVKVLSRKLRELTDLVWVKSLPRQGQKLDLHTISSHFTQFAGKYPHSFVPSIFERNKRTLLIMILIMK